MRFEIRHPSHREEVSSDKDIVVFGRDPSCDVVIRNPRCSRRHASIRSVPDGFHLLDMGSSNGVYVLGQKVDDAIISEGDVFSMGDVYVRILPDDMPATLAMSKSDATVMQASRSAQSSRSVQSSPSLDPPKRALPPPPPRVARPAAPPPAPSLLAPTVLAITSSAVGVALIAGPLAMGPQLGGLAYVLPVLGLLSALAGLMLMAGVKSSRYVHYLVFTVWVLTCLLAPLGVVGLAYQLRGEDRPETDSFFAVILGVAGAMAVIALIVTAFLARIYVPAPLPL